MSIIWIAFVGLFVFAALRDARVYRIPNWISVALVALFVIAVFASGKPVTSFWPHIALGAAALAFGYLLFSFTNMGAGDAKLAGAAVVWAGGAGLYAFFVALAFAMAILVLGLIGVRLILSQTLKTHTHWRVLKRDSPAPLGVAAAAAAIAASGRFNGALWAF